MITEQQSEMIDYLIQGNSKVDTAKLLGVSRQTVHTWSNLPEVMEEKKKRLKEIRENAKSTLAPKVKNCFDKMYDLAMTCKDARVSFQACKYICDQVVGTPTAEKTEEENKDKTIEVSLLD